MKTKQTLLKQSPNLLCIHNSQFHYVSANNNSRKALRSRVVRLAVRPTFHLLSVNTRDAISPQLAERFQ